MTVRADAATTPSNLTVKNKIGLVLAGVFGLWDLAGPVTSLGTDPHQPGPPLAVIIADSVIGLVTLIAVVWTWRTTTRVGARIVAGTRILSVLTALPAFFVSGVPAAVVTLVAVAVLLTIVTVVLVLSRPATA
jgi:hypothetical protein